ncbi:MAG TPA: hypothetical protein VHM19_03165 [Polyangiales bacterium]|jgi:hypothetical protein|nr:hypothetical protein [Polyangiales bacterium]
MRRSLLGSHVLFGASVAAVLLGVSRPAVAIDDKSIPGTLCREQGTTNYWRPNASNIATNTWLGGQVITVVCPLVRDDTLNLDGLSSLKVAYIPGGSVAIPNCTAYSLNAQGQQLAQAYAGGSSAGGWMDFGAKLNVSAKDGSYVLSCWMPPGTSIIEIRYDEN